MLTLEQITDAKKRFDGIIETTPLQYSQRLSKQYDANIYLKREDLNDVRSYKIRGAYNMMSQLSDEQKASWVVCASAWNHAQWFAKSCKLLWLQWVVFMPVTTPGQKVYKTKQFGWGHVEVRLIWDTFDQALQESQKYQQLTWATFVHPFDDIQTICGQATVGLEIHSQLEQLWKQADYILCPIGWGWFISGIISATNALEKNDCFVIWIEPEWAPSMQTSIDHWLNTSVDIQDTFVDWASVWRVWEQPFEICNNYWLEVLTSPENRVCSTIEDFLKEEWIIIEPAWALAADGLKDMWERIKWKTVVVTISGSNFDFERLPEVKERSLRFEQLKKYFLVTFPQRPWALKDFLSCLWADDDIERFEYLKKSAKNTAPVFIWLKTTNKDNWTEIESKIQSLWFSYADVTNDEMYFSLLV